MSELHPLLGMLEQVSVTLIDTDDDRRPLNEEHIGQLRKSIHERGLIQPIALYHPPTRARYRLIAGRHRFKACLRLNMSYINARVYTHELNEYELKALELYENIHRKDLTGPGLSQQTERLHTLMQHIYGPPIPGKAAGHAIKDTARIIGKSVGSVHGDIKLAKAMEQFPELQLDKVPNKSSAMRILHRFASTIMNQEVAKNLNETGELRNSSTQKLLSAYKLCDFFAADLPRETFSLIEVDPPYGIDLTSVKSVLDGGALSAYNEIPSSEYKEFLHKLTTRLYSLASPNSWTILWFANKWYKDCIDALLGAGFQPVEIPAIWKKGNVAGQALSTGSVLANSYESFIYARKGAPKLHLMGRSNIFDYTPLPAGQKIHPTERPVELVRDILNTFARAGTAVLSPFLGSGNTLVAAQELGMPCIGCELSETYYNAFVARVLGKTK